MYKPLDIWGILCTQRCYGLCHCPRAIRLCALVSNPTSRNTQCTQNPKRVGILETACARYPESLSRTCCMLQVSIRCQHRFPHIDCTSLLLASTSRPLGATSWYPACHSWGYLVWQLAQRHHYLHVPTCYCLVSQSYPLRFSSPLH